MYGIIFVLFDIQCEIMSSSTAYLFRKVQAVVIHPV